MATTARCGRSSRSLESLGIWRRSYRCRGEWWAPAWCRILMDPQSSSILRELGVNSEVTRLSHRVLWTEAFFGVKKIAMHHASRSAKPPFAFVQHFSTCCNSFSPPILSPSSATAFCMAPIERCYKTSDDSCILPSLPQKVPHIFRGVGSG